MISGNGLLTPAGVAEHYDELDAFYRDVWGDHVHHGYWITGRESHREATLELVRRVAALARVRPGARVCDIGCGYGATARMLAAQFGAEVTGVTVSAAQHDFAGKNPAPGVSILHGDWLHNTLPSAAFDAAIAIESSEHMPDLPAFFRQAARILRPGGRLVVCAWLAHPQASPVQRALLLEPICREGRMAHIGLTSEYRALFGQSGFTVESEEDASRRVRRTWPLCAALFARRLLRDPRYIRFLLNRHRRNRVFALTVFRLWAAFNTGAMRYGILSGIRSPN